MYETIVLHAMYVLGVGAMALTGYSLIQHALDAQ